MQRQPPGDAVSALVSASALAGKRALVTGARKGIGRGVALWCDRSAVAFFLGDFPVMFSVRLTLIFDGKSRNSLARAGCYAVWCGFAKQPFAHFRVKWTFGGLFVDFRVIFR